MNAFTSASPSSAPKRRRLPGSCDLCKTKRIRCDSAKMPGGICSNCLKLEIDCKDHGRIRPTLPGTSSSTEDHHNISLFKENRETRNLVATVLSTTTPYAVPNDHSTIRLTIVELSRYIQTLEREIINLKRPQDSGSVHRSSSPPAGSSDIHHSGNILSPQLLYTAPEQGYRSVDSYAGSPTAGWGNQGTWSHTRGS
ncbi:hypothetical protein C8J56DRAFT_915155 [Mycena floridula]|nr:hypothetical protein C8J56DRAFT_915155 [Mycena floridula]